MLKARAEGKLSGLEGVGQARCRGTPRRPSSIRARQWAIRIMAEHGALPEEGSVLRKELAAAKAVYAAAEGDEGQARAMARSRRHR